MIPETIKTTMTDKQVEFLEEALIQHRASQAGELGTTGTTGAQRCCA